MRYKPFLKILLIFVVLGLITSQTGLASRLLDMMADPTDGIHTLTEAGISAVGQFSTVAGELSLESASRPPSLLAPEDYQDTYNRAMSLVQIAQDFREEFYLSPQGDNCDDPQDADDCQFGPSPAIFPSGSLTDTLKNYLDVNDGEYLKRFCIDYDPTGYCEDTTEDGQKYWDPPTGPPKSRDIRNKLLRARELFAALSQADPVSTMIQNDGGEDILARELGRDGIRGATRELANVHLIFGNEFLQDVSAYRYVGAVARAEDIIYGEIDLLEKAQGQFTMVMDLLVQAFNTRFGGPSGVYFGDYFTGPEFELFGIANERLVMTIEEIANRYRQLGRDDDALALYNQGYTDQYVQALALASKAMQTIEDDPNTPDIDESQAAFLDNNGWELMANLERLRAEALAIQDGIDLFGYAEEYVPLSTFSCLVNELERPYGHLYGVGNDEGRAREENREFVHNAYALVQELEELEIRYDDQLKELCGDENGPNFETCDGGLMNQNFYEMRKAFQDIELAELGIRNIVETIEDEREKAQQLQIIWEQYGLDMDALEYAIGVENAYRVTQSTVKSSTSSDGWGLSDYFAVGVGLGSCYFSAGAGCVAAAGVVVGKYSHSDSTTTSITRVWDPAQEEIARLRGEQAILQAALQAQIIGIESDHRIRALLREQAAQVINRNKTIDTYNQLSDVHNDLVAKYHRLLNQRHKAQRNLLGSYLNNPAYRVMRDHWIDQAAYSHGKAAQYTYLVAKALEYKFLFPWFELGEQACSGTGDIRICPDDIYGTRREEHLRNYLNSLKDLKPDLEQIAGPPHHDEVVISVAQDILGFSDEYLDPNNQMSDGERRALRRQMFQDLLAQHVVTDTDTGEEVAIEFQFSTAISQTKASSGGFLFNPDIWNTRITGIDNPDPDSCTSWIVGEGLVCNIKTLDGAASGTPPYIHLTHGGEASYRNISGDIVSLSPGPTQLAGFSLPPEFDRGNVTPALVNCTINCSPDNPDCRRLVEHSGQLYNRSPIASDWTLRIRLNQSADLDWFGIDDIEIYMDTVGYVLAAENRGAPVMEAFGLQAESDQ